ncbi:MAG: PBP1A family penicillin-binding protein [Alphaproteobacteria bacterium]
MYNRARRRGRLRKYIGEAGLWAVGWRFALLGALVGGAAILYVAHTLPDIRALSAVKKEQGITVETADGKILATYGDVYGNYIPYAKVPKSLIEAVVATEDRRFFVHHGVDFFGIMRAAFEDVIHGHVVQGGSTITQQVAKNVFLTPRRSIVRKLQEILLAFLLEGRYSKQEIMAIYLNRVYLGAGTYGIDAASRRYFNKPATDLNLIESAILAGLLKAPSHFAPTSSVVRAKERASVVLANMVDAGFIKKSQATAALASFNASQLHSVEGNSVRYFTDWVVDDLQNYISGVNEDLVVTTTLDPALEADAQDALENTLSTEGPKKKVTQGALVAMTPDGAVKAMVGGLSYAESQYNRATQAKRQPGSSFKLFVYLAALENGFTPQTVVLDAPISLQVGNRQWSPENFEDEGYKGELPLYQALRYSLNTVSVRIGEAIGFGRIAEMAGRLGIPNVPPYPSISLGAVEATLLEMTSAYATLPNHGRKVEPYGILTIKTTAGEDVYAREEEQTPQVVSETNVAMMNYMLLDVVHHGTGFKANLPGRDAAGKTGTSQDYKDAWFIGFTPQLVAGVWVGNDNNASMNHVAGGTLPAPIWHDFMVKAMQGQPAESIANNPGDNTFLPWLFGGDQAAPPGAVNSGGVMAPQGQPAGQPLPQQVPFGFAPPPGEAAPGQPQPPSQPNIPPGYIGQQQAPQSDSSPLTPQFWHTLMNKVPTPPGKKVEYTYPNENRR